MRRHFARGVKRNGIDRANEARPAPAADRRASQHGLKRVSYDWRALVEGDIGRYKRVIGDPPRSRTERRETTEVAIAVASLNPMLELRRPEYVRLNECRLRGLSSPGC